jgi:signal recognition particle receptor subunit beta
MNSAADSEPTGPAPTPVKIVVSGGFGVGKTTFVGAASEIAPVRTEEVLTASSVGIDDLSATPDKSTTTVAMDFGRISLREHLVLYLFGTPGQERFWFMWDDIVHGAIGAVVLVDTRRLIESFPVIDYFERTRIPFVIGVNGFDGQFPFTEAHIRESLALPSERPVVNCDARDTTSATRTLVTVVEYALANSHLGVRQGSG